MLFLFSLIFLNSFSFAADWKATVYLPERLETVIQSNNPGQKKENASVVPKVSITYEEKMKPSVATNRFQQKALVFSNLYGYSNSPYRGAISKIVRCENKEAHPKKEVQKTKTQELVSYRFFTNSYFTLGVCEKADQKYAALMLQIFCPSSGAFAEISIYDVHGSDLLELAKLIRCK